MMENKKGLLNLVHDWIQDVESESAGSNYKDIPDQSIDNQQSIEANINGLEPIAIIGLSGFFPGCMNVQSFWDHLDRDESLITEIPRERFDWKTYYNPNGKKNGSMCTKWGGFIPDIASFDPGLFNILPAEADEIDPRHRLLLMSTWQTLEDAGIDPLSLKKSNTGVFIGCEDNEYAQLMRDNGVLSEGLFNQADSMIANRISYHFDFSGPSEFVNTMCSAFAVALHRAVVALRAGEIDRAIVGAANIMLLPDLFIRLSEGGQLSTQKMVKSFGRGGDGYIRSEGVGTVLIKRLSDAKNDHRSIYATIKHTAVNYNGQGGLSIATPNTEAHKQVMKTCYREAGINPVKLAYIEAQGMGLPVADIAEWAAMNRALTELIEEGGYTIEPGFCRVSTLKPMAGHMQAASSLGGLLKIIRSFQTKKIHKVLGYTEPNEFCDMENTPCRIVTDTEFWAETAYPRLAALHSYGSGGNNAHVLLEEFHPDDSNEIRDQNTLPVMICLSAKTENQLRIVVQRLHEHLTKMQDIDLIDLSFTLNTGRPVFDYRCAILAKSIEELIHSLNRFKYEDMNHPCFSGRRNAESVIDLTLQVNKIDFNDLAIKWVNGASIKNPRLLYFNQPVHQLTGLPGYPFEKKRYWFQSQDMRSVEESQLAIPRETLSQNQEMYDVDGIKKLCIHILTNKLAIPKEQIDDKKEFSQYGLNSINATLFIRELNKEIPVTVAPKLFFIFPNISDFSQAVTELLQNEESTGTSTAELTASAQTATYDFSKKCNALSCESGNAAHWSDSSIVFEMSIHENEFRDLVSGVTDPTTMHRDDMSITPSDNVTFFQYVDKIFEVFFYFYNVNKLNNQFQGHLIQEIYKSGKLSLPSQKEFSIYPWAIPYDLGRDIYHFIVKNNLSSTLEIGLAYGLSALFICEAHQSQKNGFHMAIDPEQEKSFQNIALTQLEKANLSSYFEHVNLPDYLALPKLLNEQREFDFIFIDGLHLFDYVLLDFFYADLLLKERGYIAFDDSRAPGVSPVLDFIRKNRDYREIPSSINRLTIFQKNDSDQRFLGDPSGFVECFGKSTTFRSADNSQKTVDHQELMQTFVSKISDFIRCNLFPIEKPWNCIINLEGKRNTSWKVRLTQDRVEYAFLKLKQHPLRADSQIELKNNEGHDTKHDSHDSVHQTKDKIAIVGISARLPKSETIDLFWENLLNERDLFSEIPKDRWEWKNSNDGSERHANKTSLKVGGFIDDIYSFDSLFFNISPDEAKLIDPHQRLLLEETYKCIEDAGYKLKDLAGSNTSVFIAIHNNSFQERHWHINMEIDPSLVTGDHRFTANRISYFFNFNGSSEIINAACASTSVAICRAVKSLQHGECDIVLVGAASIDFSNTSTMGLSKLGIISQTNACAPFNEEISGLIPGEGVGVIMLKRLSDAEIQKDNIYGAIAGSGINHAGNLSGSFLIPNSISQINLMQRVLNETRIRADQIDYIEAHGTGGHADAIELEAIKKVFGKENVTEDINNEIHIGSVKSYLGFSDAASGIPQLVKVILMMKYKTFIPTLNFQNESSSVSLKNTGLSILKEKKAWSAGLDDDRISRSRIAAINSYGLGGTTAFLLVEEYDKSAPNEKKGINRAEPFCIPLSAPAQDALRSYAERIHQYILRNNQINLDELAYTLQVGRQACRYRIVFIINSTDELVQKLDQFLKGEQHIENCIRGTADQELSEATFREVFEDNDFKQMAAQWVVEGKLKPLVSLWIKGIEIGWEPLYPEVKPWKISVPSCPLAHRIHKPEIRVEQHHKYKVDEQKNTVNKQMHSSLDNINETVVKIVQNNLDLGAGDFEFDTPFSELGVDSLRVVQLVANLESEFNIKLRTSDVYSYPSIEKITEYIASVLKENCIRESETELTQSANKKLPVHSGMDYDQNRPIDNEDIAIIGMSLRSAGANNYTEFWSNLKQKYCGITDLPEDRELTFDSERLGTLKGGYLSDADKFDSSFFNFTPEDANCLDPGHRILLESAYAAIEDSGYSPASWKGTKNGIFIGLEESDYPTTETSKFTSVHGGTASARIGYYLDTSGPLLTLNTACSSSLVAVHYACKSLLDGESDCALAGGCHITCDPVGMLSRLSQTEGMVSPDGTCYAFDQRANGMVIGEGVGVVVLKRLSDACRNHDTIHGIIKGTGINFDGKSNGLTAPNGARQRELYEHICMKSGVEPHQISYIAAHGTGTPLGDSVECNALIDVHKASTNRKQYCALTSVKTNIGHTLAASGVINLISATLALKHKQIPPTLNFDYSNNGINFKGSPFYVNTSLKEWTMPERYAAVNAFGHTGTNAHVILCNEDASTERNQAVSIHHSDVSTLFILSAKNVACLKSYARVVASYLASCDNLDLRYFCYTFQVGREAMSERLAVISTDKDSLMNTLTAFVEERHTEGPFFRGSLKKNSAISREGTSSNARLIEEYFRDREYAHLAEWWVKGLDIAWNQMYEPGNIRRLAGLPTYPFVRERYWLKVENSKESGRVNDVTGPVKTDRYSSRQFPLPEKNNGINNHSSQFDIEETAQLFILKLVADQLQKPVSVIDSAASFSDIGLTSAGLVSMTKEIKNKIHSEFLPSLFFEYTTPSDLSSYLAKNYADAVDRLIVPKKELKRDISGTGLIDDQKILVSRPIKTGIENPLGYTSDVEPSEVENRPQKLSIAPKKYPLSEDQKGVWALQKTYPEMTAYNVPLCFRVFGINIDLFKKSCQFSVMQHPILYSMIREENGIPYQWMLPAQDLVVEQEDLSDFEPNKILAYLKKKNKEFFVLNEDPLLRIHLFSLSSVETIVLMDIHHLVFDGNSISILLRTLFDAYRDFINGKDPILVSLPATYYDFVKEEQRMLESEEGESRLLFWKQQLSEPLPHLTLPTDYPRSSTQNEFLGKTRSQRLPSELCVQIKRFAKSQQTYLSAVFMGLLDVLLHQYTGQRDLVVGMPVNGRNQARFDQVLGYLINMVPMRSKISKNESFLAFLNTLQKTIVNGMAHAYPFSALIRGLDIPIVDRRAPVFQVAFLYQDFFKEIDRQEFPIQFVEGMHQEGEYEIVLEVFEHQDSFVLNWKYNPELFDESTIIRMMGHYSKLIEAVISQPQLALDEYSIVSKEEEKIVLRDWNNTQAAYPKDMCVHELFVAQAEKYPQATAVVFKNQSLTYNQLDQKSTALGQYLQNQGLRSNELVGIYVDRSPDILVAFLGVLKAGGAYVPLDPEYPEERLKYILKHSEAHFILTQSRLKKRVEGLLGPQSQSETSKQGTSIVALDEPWPDIQGIPITLKKVPSCDLAYVIYTSGSTGSPKGVMIRHQALTNLLVSMTNRPGLHRKDKLLAVTTYSFDLSVPDLYLPIINGAQCHICDLETSKDVERLKKCIQQIKPSIMQATPSTWMMLFHAGWKNEENLKILCGGDALTEPLKKHFVRTKSQAWNLFGPTETTVWSVIEQIEAERPITIGKPIANTQIYILDFHHRPTPIGIPGELCIAGEGLANGYFNQPELTAEKFIDNPFNPETKLYRTGDLARWRIDGRLEFLGRMDFQVKIHGFRIELGEIECQLNRHSDIKESVVIVKENAGSKQLVAYYVPHRPGKNDSKELKRYLETKLPEYMVPAFLIPLDTIPLSSNGKLDRKALMSRKISIIKNDQRVLPASAIEKKVLQLWQEILEVQNIGITDGFFAVGGNSISAVILSDKISKTFHVSFTAKNLFKYSNVQLISQYLNEMDEVISPSEAGQEELTKNQGSSSRLFEGEDSQKPYKYPDYYKESLAIIGMSCHFPGATNYREFWHNLKEGKESTRFLSNEELFEANVPEKLINNPHYVPMQLAINGKDLFDPGFFSLLPNNATLMDPQFRLLLLHSWQAIEDAGYVAKDIPETSVFMSASNSYYQALLTQSAMIQESDEFVASILAQGGTIPTLISYQLGLKGTSMFVHSNCSSSLAALSVASQSLQLNEARTAMVGASTVFPPSKIGYVYEPGLNFSSDGHCRTFDASADGMIAGEGVGVIVLKKALDAIEDGDHIYALLRGIGLNNDGSDKAGFYAPSVNGQAAVIEKVLTSTGIDPRSIGYVEAHGTGTKLGDPIEVMALTEAYQKYTPQKQYCALGSVKPNIGHLDTAAGLAGCIKVALSLKNKEIPPSINYTKPNREINFEQSPFYVIDRLKKWSEESTPRRAALTSLGIGGTNGHAILEEYQAVAAEQASVKLNHGVQNRDQQVYVVPLSAKNKERVYTYAKKLLTFLKEHQNNISDLRNLSYTLQIGREAMQSRVIFIVRCVDELIEKLEGFIGEKKKKWFVGEVRKGNNGSESFEHNEDSEQRIHKWIVKGKFKKLAKFWIKGGHIEWTLLYQDDRPQRMSLPTYPFAEEYYGIQNKAGKICGTMQEYPSLKSDGEVSKRLETSGMLMLRPVWRENSISPGKKDHEYAEHKVFLCGFRKNRQRLQDKASELSFVHLESDEKTLENRFEDYSLELFENIQTILQEKSEDQVLLQVLVPDKGPEQVFSGLSGLLKTAHIENPRIVGQIIIIQEEERTNDLIARLLHCRNYPEYHQFRYGGEKCFVSGFEEETSSELGRELPWKEGGVYLITGGGGGLGWMFSREIAEKIKNVKLILTGRSELETEKKERLKDLEFLGAKLEYHVSDVSDKDSVEILIRKVQKDFGEINGIIHSAGIIKDNFILKKTKEEFAQVLAPKVKGVMNLDEATKNLEHLDFFVMFSSASGALGSAGQADYSAANAFMDSYATVRQSLCERRSRSGRTLSINWPLWKEGNMGVDETTEKILKDGLGMLPMKTSSGIAAFYRSLSSNPSQVLVMNGILKKMKQNLLVDKSEKLSEKKTTPASPVNFKTLQAKTLHRLKLLVGKEMKFPASRFDPEEALESYGIDSIIITRLNQKLEDIFGEISKTLFFEYQTLGALTVYFITNYSQACVQWIGLQEEPSTVSEEIVDERSFAGTFSSLTSLKLKKIRSCASASRVMNNNGTQEPTAIIGISGRYPQADNLEDYWRNLKSGKNCIVEIPEDRWSLEGFFHPNREEAIAQGKSYCKWGGFLEGFSEFDPLFFNISPREAMNMDPQERLFLQSCWELFEDAGYTRERLARQHKGRVGVFAGITKTGYALYGPELWQRGEQIYPYTSFSSVANRVSFLLNLEGPSIPIDTMCSSSLTAIHEACKHLHQDECEMAIAGGVNLYLHPSTYTSVCSQSMLSTNGQCKSFGKGGNGFVPGEGVGVILLKSLAKAVKDGDYIYAIIRGSSTNHGGKTNGYTVPNPNAQRDLIRETLDKSGTNARMISYVEAHGTGTELGDPIEITGLTQAFQKDTGETGFCAIGSAKSNVGHLEAAAGIAGITKILLQMKHQILVPSLHAKTLNPNIDFKKTPFVVQQKLAEWKRPMIETDGRLEEYPRIAGISSFGAGGSNAHVILEEYDNQLSVKSDQLSIKNQPVLIVLSARNKERLKEYAKKLLKYVSRHLTPDTSLLSDHSPQSTDNCSLLTTHLFDLAYTLQVGREAMEERLGLIVYSLHELMDKLHDFIEGNADVEDLYLGRVKRKKDSLAVFAADEDMTKMIATWIRKEKYNKLLDLWVKGLIFDWEQLYGDKKTRRISAPTYPFARDRYWPQIKALSFHSKKNINNEVLCGEGITFDQSHYEKIVGQLETDEISVTEALKLTRSGFNGKSY